MPDDASTPTTAARGAARRIASVSAPAPAPTSSTRFAPLTGSDRISASPAGRMTGLHSSS
jgi:hypothetical protein